MMSEPCLRGCPTCTVRLQMSICSLMRRSIHTKPRGIPSSPLARWGGVAACLGGISYGAYGYFSDNPDVPRLIIAAVVPLLKLATPALFLGGVMDEEHGMGLWATLPHLGGGRTLLYTGLTVVGLATLGKDASRLLGALVLGSGALGWVSLLTDPGYSGILASMRSLHVAFAALFCLSCVVWGGVLFSEAS